MARQKFIAGEIVRFEGGDKDGDYSGIGTIERVDHRHLLVSATHDYHGDSMYHGANVMVKKCDAARLDADALLKTQRLLGA